MKLGPISRAVGSAALAVAIVALLGGAGATAAPAKPQTLAAQEVSLTAPATGSFTDALGGTGTATGSFAPSRFIANGENLSVEGVLTLALVDSAGAPVGTATPTVTFPVDRPAGGFSALAQCQILDLVLGPLDLDLLGLVVHLDRVHLNITAESGPGNLLGNLLCAVAGLLNGPVDLGLLTNLLNAILALINA